MQLVYATGNPGKFQEVSKLFGELGLPLHAPSEFGVTLTIDENGTSLEENATKKAEGYLKHLPDDSLVLGDDTGVFIAALNGAPGIRVRRWKGYEMTDQEIIDYCLSEMKDVPSGSRQAEFKTVIAVAGKARPTLKFEGRLLGSIVQEPSPQEIPGFPFESLFFANEYNLLLADIHQLTIQEKVAKNILTHRERAIMLAVPSLRGLLGLD